MEPTNRVLVKDNTGGQFGVDLEQAQRFEIPRSGDHFDVYYRFSRDLWVREEPNVFNGSLRYRVVELIDIIYMFLSDQRSKAPEDLMPMMEYSVSWISTLDHEIRRRVDEEEGTWFWEYRKASLFRLRNGVWALVELAHPSGAAPHQILSDEEAVDLLLRNGHPIAKLPDDLWEVCKRKRPGTRQSPSKCDDGRHTIFDQVFQLTEEQEPNDHSDEHNDPELCPRVVLRGREESPIVLGKAMRKLTTPQYNVVKALLEAGDAGLSKDELISMSTHEDARGILKRLASSQPEWKEVIHFAGRTGRRYRIR